MHEASPKIPASFNGRFRFSPIVVIVIMAGDSAFLKEIKSEACQCVDPLPHSAKSNLTLHVDLSFFIVFFLLKEFSFNPT